MIADIEDLSATNIQIWYACIENYCFTSKNVIIMSTESEKYVYILKGG